MTVDSWFEGYVEEGPMANIAVVDPVTGQLTVNGVSVFPIDKTLAEFQALSTGDVADKAVIHITNVHDRSGAGGVYVTWDAIAAKWAQNFGVSFAFSARAAALAAFPAASFPGFRIYSADYGEYKGGYEISDGTAYVLENDTIIHRTQVQSNVLVLPAVAASAAADNAGTVRLTFGSAHGITSGVAYPGGVLPNAQLYVTTSGNGWAAGTWHTITNIPDITHIDVSTNSSGITGAPTLATVVSASVVPMKTITVPPLSASGSLVIDLLTYATVSANNKNLTIKLNGSTLFNPTWSSATSVAQYTNSRFIFNNVNSRSSQKTASGATQPIGTNTSSGTAPGTSSIDTSVPTTLTINWQPTTVNERMHFESVNITARP